MSADLLAEFGSFTPEKTQIAEYEGSPSLIFVDNLTPDLAHLEPAKQMKISDSNVLFDADEGDDSDEFGDFEKSDEFYLQEDTKSSAPVSQHLPDQLNLLDLDDDVPPQNVTVAHHGAGDSSNAENLVQPLHEDLKESGDNEWGTFEEMDVDTHVNEIPALSAKAVEPNSAEEEHLKNGWDAFEDVDDQLVHETTPESQERPWSLQHSRTPTALSSYTPVKPAITENIVRPTNIPPPAVLIQILPVVFEIIVNGISHNSQNATEMATEIAQAYVVAARILAGRSLRWKRDSILAQSMKIGPATGRKGGGMKLKSLDKTEAVKEEQEAQEAITSWSQNAHRLNSVVAKAGQRRSQMVLSMKVSVRVIQSPGILTAPYACAMCGLRRDERLPTVDTDADDSFGEFWVEHWGHRDCKDFWDAHKNLLPKR